MQQAWFKKISILLIGLFLLVDSNMLETITTYLKVSDLIETSSDKFHYEEEPAETNPLEKSFEKSEFIIDDLNSLINPITSFISNSYSLANTKFWNNRAMSVLTPPPNHI